LRLVYRTIIYCSFFFPGYAGLAQTNAMGAWNIISFKLNLDKRWSVFEESQLRSQLFYNNFSYYEIKGGASYSLKKNISLLAGGGRFITFSDGDNFKKPYVNKEWRIWEQVVLNNYLGRLKIENRIRVEQRWTSNLGYRNRFKYRLNLVLPITDKKIKPGTFYLSSWDELYFTDSKPNFESNRAFAGAGCQLTKHMTIQSGYLYQVNYKPDDTRSGKNYLQTALLVDVNGHKEHHEKTPASVD
jgi:hypothetical protein